MSDIVIKDWPAKYYNNDTKIWIKGFLILQSSCLTFIAHNESIHHTIWFEDISRVYCDKCSLIFDAIVIEVGTDKHWFSSLPNSLIVYNHIEHFWKEQLITEASSSSKSKTGKELLDLAHDSLSTLSSATNTLYHQGKQLESTENMMLDIHGCLAKAEKLLNSCESLCRQWQYYPTKYNPKIMNSSQENSQTSEYSVLYGHGIFSADKLPHKLGILQFTSSWIRLLDEQQTIIFNFDHKLIKCIKVLTPWDVMITGCEKDKVDQNFSLTSSKLILVLHEIEQLYNNKICYEEPKEVRRLKQKQMTFCKPAEKSFFTDGAGVSESSGLQDFQAVTESEQDELCKFISNMKTMALDINKEIQTQNETIENIIPSVETANERLKKTITQMNRIM